MEEPRALVVGGLVADNRLGPARRVDDTVQRERDPLGRTLLADLEVADGPHGNI